MLRRLMVVPIVWLSACLCGEPPTLEGRVVDPWDHPVDGVKVSMPGVPEPAITNDKGRFSFPLRAGKYKLRGQKEGYISGEVDVDVKDDEATSLTRIRVIPEPTADGYHVVGPESYLQLQPEQVVRLGNELQVFQGIKSSGNVEADGKELRVVFHTPLKMDQVARLDIELHKLTFTKDMQVATVEGATPVDVNLWTDAGKVDFAREELGSDDNYVFRMDNLPSGTYAFVSMDLLDTKNERFDQLSEAIRLVHPFSVK